MRTSSRKPGGRGAGTPWRAFLLLAFVVLSVRAVYTQTPRTWTGAVSTDWSDPDNWSPAGVPAPDDDVTIPGAAPLQPVLTADAAARNVTLQGSSRLQINGRTLTVAGALSVTLESTAGCGLIMADPADRVVVAGDATFTHSYGHGTATSSGKLAAGELHVGGDFTQTNGGWYCTGEMFRSTGTKVVFDGAAAQSITFVNPGPSLFGDVDVSNPAGVTFATDVYVTGQLRMVGAGKLAQGSAQQTYYPTALPVTSAGYTVVNTRVDGNVTLGQDADIPNGGRLFVDSGRTLALAGHSLLVSGELVVTLGDSAGAGLIMTNAADRLTVNGTATFTHQYGSGTATSSGKLTAGELHLRGDFVQTNGGWYCNGEMFAPTGTKVVFDGSTPQSASFANPGPATSRFQDVEVGPTASVQFTTNVWVTGQLTLSGGSLSQPPAQHLYCTTQLPVTAGTYGVPNTHAAGTITLAAPRSLPQAVNDLFVDSGARLDVNGHSLDVGGSLCVTLADAAGSGLILTTAATVTVGGAATFTHEYGAGSATSLGKLTAGELHVRGDFTQSNGGWYCSGEMFVSTGTKVFLDGASPQKVSFANPGPSSFRDVDISNPAGVTFLTDVHVTGQLRMVGSGTLSQAGGLNTWYTTALPITTTGYSVVNTRVAGAIAMGRDAYVPNGGMLFVDAGTTLTLTGHALSVAGDLLVTLSDAAGTGLRMTDPLDRLTVGGSATFTHVFGNGSATSGGKLTAGELHVHGDFVQSNGGWYCSGEMFAPAGTRVFLDGTSPQKVSFANPGPSSFRDVEVSNPAGVTLLTDLYVTGQLRMVGSGTLSQAGSLNTWYTAALPATTNGYSVANHRLVGSVTMGAAAVIPNGGSLYIDAGTTLTLAGHTLMVAGDLLVTLSDAAGTGLRMTDPLDRLTVGGSATFTHVFGNGSATSSGKLAAGELHVHGDFVQSNGGWYCSGEMFASTGTRVFLDGTSPQSVSFLNGQSHFSDLVITNPAGVTLSTNVSCAGVLSNSGSLAIPPGSVLAVSGGAANTTSGTIRGAGTLSLGGGTLTNAGTVSPGLSAGVLTVDGSYMQTATGALAIEVGGLAAGSQYDRLAVTGTAGLDGTLRVTSLGGFVPAVGNTFLVLTCASRSGSFAALDGLDFGGGAYLSPRYNATDLTLQGVSASRVAFISQPQSSTAGAPIPAFQVAVQDGNGDLVEGATHAVTIAIDSNPVGGTLSGTATVNAVNGVATFAGLSIEKVAVGYTLTASATGLSYGTSAAFDVSHGAAAKLTFQEQPADTVAGDPVSVRVMVEDAYRNPVTDSAAPVALAVGSGPAGATLSGTTAVPAVSGRAVFSDLSLDKAGAGYTLAASSAGLTGATSTAFTISPAAPDRLAFLVQPGEPTVRRPITPALEVEVQDRFGNRVPGAAQAVTIAVGSNPGGGTLSGSATAAPAAGVATFAGLSIDQVGSGYTLTASASGLTGAASASFDVTEQRLAFTVPPAGAAAGAGLEVRVAIQDVHGATLSGATDSVTVALGTNPGGGTLSGTTTAAAVDGVASFPGLSIEKAAAGYTFVASAPGIAGTTSSAFTINPAVADRLAFTVQPANAAAGAAIAPAVQVTVRDAFDNTVTGAGGNVTLALGANPVGGALAGTLSSAPVNGVATFADLSIEKAGAGYTLSASAAGLTGAASAPFDVDPAAPARLTFVAQPGGATAGAAIAPAPAVSVEDAFGNRVTTATPGVTLALGSNPGGGTLAGTATVNATSGLATFAGLSIEKAGSGYTLAASSAGLAEATSAPFDIAPAAGAALAVVQQPTNTQSGSPIAPAVKVEVHDAYGNLAGGATDSISVALGANPAGGTLAGTTTVAAAGGVAAFTDLSIARAGAGCTLVFSAAGLTPATTTAFDVLSGSAARLAFSASPSAATAGAGFTFGVVIQDSSGNRVPDATHGVTVALGASPSGGTLAGTTTLNATAGGALFTGLSIAKAGAGYTLTASASGLAGVESAAFTVAPAAAAALVFIGEPGAAVSGAPLAPVSVAVRDAFGNTVVSASDPVALALGTSPAGGMLSGTQSAGPVSGIATFADLSLDRAGSYTLTASAPGVPRAESAAFAVSAGAPARLAFTVQPADGTAGAALSPAVEVAVQDASGNLVPGAANSVTLALGANPGAAALSGAAVANASGGTARFAGLSIEKAGTGYTLTAATPGLSGATSAAFSIAAGAPAALAFVASPGETTAGAVISPAVRVEVRDALGNLAAGAAPSISLALGGGASGAQLLGTTSASPAGSAAAFGDLRVERAGAGYTLTASAPGLPSATCPGFDVVPGPAAKLAFVTEPGTGATDRPLTPAPRVAIEDAFGNVVSVATSQVALALGSNPGGAKLAGTLSVGAQDGVAAFADLTLNRGGSGYTVAASTAGLSGATSEPFDVLVLDRPDLLIRAGAEPEAALALDGVYQAVPAGEQARNATTHPNAGALFHVRVENDGNMARAFLLRASGSPASGWSAEYRAGTADVTAAIRGAGWKTSVLEPGGGTEMLVDLKPDATVPNGESFAVTVGVFLNDEDTEARDAVSAAVVVKAVTLSGTVRLQDGAPAPSGTVVELRDADDAVAASLPVGADGRYRISGRPGADDVVVRASGFVPLRRRDVDPAAGSVDFTLLPQPDLGPARSASDTGMRMVALPFGFLHAGIEQVLGDPDVVAEVWDPAAGRYRMAGAGSFPDAAPGVGFWLKQRRLDRGISYRIEEPAEVPDPSRPVVIPLVKGWQLVGNPFVGALTLAQVKVLAPGSVAPVTIDGPGADGVVAGHLWGWNGSSYELVSTAAVGATTRLAAYRAYWVLARVDGARLLVEPPGPAGVPEEGRAHARRAPDGGWSVRLTARSGGRADTDNFLGVGSAALTIEGPPPMDGYVDVRFTGAPGRQGAVDLREKGAGRESWPFEVASDLGGEEITLAWNDLSRVPRGTRLVLVDEQTGARRQMRTTAGFTFRAGTEARRFRVDAEPAAGPLVAITDVQVLPSRGGARSISYTLSGPATTSVSILSPTGRLVRRVAAGTAAAAGRNFSVWDGRDERGAGLASGVVLVEVTATTDEGAVVRVARPVVLTR